MAADCFHKLSSYIFDPANAANKFTETATCRAFGIALLSHVSNLFNDNRLNKIMIKNDEDSNTMTTADSIPYVKGKYHLLWD